LREEGGEGGRGGDRRGCGARGRMWRKGGGGEEKRVRRGGGKREGKGEGRQRWREGGGVGGDGVGLRRGVVEEVKVWIGRRGTMGEGGRKSVERRGGGGGGGRVREGDVGGRGGGRGGDKGGGREGEDGIGGGEGERQRCDKGWWPGRGWKWGMRGRVAHDKGRERVAKVGGEWEGEAE